MTIWKYTKKIIMNHYSDESLEAHLLHVNEHYDWYFTQIEAGLADPTMTFMPLYHVSATVIELLAADQAQADSHIAVVSALGARLGHPASATVVDVDYTTDTIPNYFIIQ